ncbi:hypothetical protein MHH60_23650 [Paenibacillus sp. FSL H7-0716]|uniref:Secreted protein n=1 Tax=Paenibacillus odorifer TaxID=189426 RepID=A0AB36JIW1_9BACL|nr:hypothetical protein [Paenibacillus odorifer]OME22077.1 hypothetical protein BSK47_07830 [Paenibacillus odorifer]
MATSDLIALCAIEILIRWVTFDLIALCAVKTREIGKKTVFFLNSTAQNTVKPFFQLQTESLIVLSAIKKLHTAYQGAAPYGSRSLVCLSNRYYEAYRSFQR